MHMLLDNLGHLGYIRFVLTIGLNGIYGIYVPLKQINIKVDEVDLAQWKLEAVRTGRSLSEWIRERCNDINPVGSGTEPRQGVHEGGGSTRTPRQASSGEVLKGALRKPPKERDMAAHGATENPIIREHDKKCQCGVCEFRRKVLK